MAIDPIQGLIDYVSEVKPFHTKILEVAVAYSHNDDVDVTITEDLQLDIALFWPGVVGSPDEGPIRVCTAGYGVEYDRSTPYIIVDANVSPSTVSLEGNFEDAFAVGSRIEIREPYDYTSFGSPVTSNTPRVATVRITSVSYDSATNTTVLGVTLLSEDFLGSPVIVISGSPLVGSPPFAGDEFWFPPYGGNDSGGDVFAIYDVVSTSTINLTFERPIVFYGSPIILGGSPFTPIWPYPEGSPLPGSPKLVSGSPATYPTFGSPMQNTAGNTIVIKSTTPEIFLYGQEVEIRNASDTDLNRNYNIYSARDLGGSPNLVELTVIDSVLADSTNDGELLFTPDGFSGGDICGDVPPELLQIHWLENLNMTWRFGDGSPRQPLESGFQHFILSADSTANTVTVQGDVRYILTEFSGSPVSPGSPSIQGSIQHARSAYGSPFWIGSPYVDLNANNGPVTITGVTYDASINRSTLTLNTVSVNDPTGWIVSTITPAPPPAPAPGAFVIALTDDGSGESSLALGVQFKSDSDVTTWSSETPPMGGSPLNVSFPGPGGLRYAESISTWVAAYKKGSNTENEAMWYSTDDGVSWSMCRAIGPGGSPNDFEFFTVSTSAKDKVLDWSPTLGMFACGGNSGRVATSTDGITWINRNVTSVFSTDQLVCVHWSAGLSLFIAGSSNNKVGYSSDGVNWTLAANNIPGSFDPIVGVYSIGTRVIVSNNDTEFAYYTDDLTTAATWTQSTVDVNPISGAGTFASNSDGSVLIWAGPGFNSGDKVWRSTDNGANFTQVDIGVTNMDSYCVAYDPDYGFMVGGNNQGGSPNTSLIVTSDDGLTWTTRLSEKFIHPDGSASNEVYVVGSKNQVTTVP